VKPDKSTNKLYLFCDASVNQKEGIGFGSFLILDQIEIDNFPSKNIGTKVQSVKFQSTSSSTLEIQTLLHALTALDNSSNDIELTIFTDSQNIHSLPGRRMKLEGNNYISKSKNTEIKNADLYRQFYKYQDELNFTIIKLKGHQKKEDKDINHQIFTLVDRESRRVLRSICEKKN